jgi:hypothetical protein
LRDTAQRGHDAPERNADADDEPAAVAVGQAGDRQSEERVEKDERKTGQHTELRVADVKIALDVLHQHRQHAAVDGRHHQGQRQNEQRVIRSRSARPCGGIDAQGATPFERPVTAALIFIIARLSPPIVLPFLVRRDATALRAQS